MLLRSRVRRAREAASTFRSSAPNIRSNTTRGLVSGGIGSVGVRHEMLLVYAQLKPLSQLPTVRESSQPSSSEAKRVLLPTDAAAIWSAETPPWISAPMVFLQCTPVR